MNKPLIHLYIVPGLAAGKEIFRNIKLPENRYEMHILEWLIPEHKESIEAYAKRMAVLVLHDNVVLAGVSFGGVVAQEMSLFLTVRKLIIISSVKSKHELPARLRFAGKTKFYKLIPTRLVLSSSNLTKFAVGPRSKKRLGMYQEYLHVRSKSYLDWAIRNMVCWNRTVALPNIVHIHGDKDVVFPIENIRNCEIIEGGTHIMLINKGAKVSQKIVDSIENN